MRSAIGGHAGTGFPLPMESYGDGFLLLSFENVDEATAPIQSKLHRIFLTLAFFCVVVAFLVQRGLLGFDRQAHCGGGLYPSPQHGTNLQAKLPELEGQSSSILEIQELAEIYNRAAVSVRAAGENLEAAYLEFVGSLANALDARDQYTAGHSTRVSQLSCATASAMELQARRGGVYSHWGVAPRCRRKIDALADRRSCKKPGRLTDEETEIARRSIP